MHFQILKQDLSPRMTYIMKIGLSMTLAIEFQLDTSKRFFGFKRTQRHTVSIPVELFIDSVSMPALPPIGGVFFLPFFSVISDSNYQTQLFKVVEVQTHLNDDTCKKIFGNSQQPFQRISSQEVICEHILRIRPDADIANLLEGKIVVNNTDTRLFLKKKHDSIIFDRDVESFFKKIIGFDQQVLPFRTWINRTQEMWRSLETLEDWKKLI